MNLNIPVKGYRMIGTIILYGIYLDLVKHQFIQPIVEIDIAAKSAIAIFFKMGLENAIKKYSGDSTLNVTSEKGDATVNVKTDKVEIKEG